ncbi:hypothetical protein U9M73_03675 [Paenibacillus phoenicis]|uniref:Uncharacterized protein n=1 Tax=Paenibacillus phoenicis TaxID=554117 RepID=A0ABU5PHB2_9BACL|nr:MULTISPECIES: hypothetical protein [Paenibacillus]MDU0331811.1 hypothetical protein [Paenibacillus sp. 3LSP]MEA3569092.1 hypothetical protein [Paenibacillus phoenicis]
MERDRSPANGIEIAAEINMAKASGSKVLVRNVDLSSGTSSA